MKIIRTMSLVKFLAAVGAITLVSAFDALIAISSFTLPFSMASMFDDAISAKFGLFILIFLGLYFVTFLVSQVLLRLENERCNFIGLLCVMGMNLCDIISAALSCLGTANVAKIINIVLSVAMVVAAWIVAAASNKEDGSLCEP